MGTLQGTPITILLVEDDPGHAAIVRRNLSGLRVANRIVHVEDGQAALDYLFREATSGNEDQPRPDMIMLDLRLPKVDGQEVLRQIKQDEKLRLIPTVVLTTSDAEQDVLQAYGHGASSYLVKPLDFSKFGEVMNAFGSYWLAWNEFPRKHLSSPS